MVLGYILWICSPCSFLYCIVRETSYENPHCATPVLYFVFWLWTVKIRSLIWLIFHKLPTFNNIINSKKNGIVGGKLVRRVTPFRFCFWLVTQERLPTPALKVYRYAGRWSAVKICSRFNFGVHDYQVALNKWIGGCHQIPDRGPDHNWLNYIQSKAMYHFVSLKCCYFQFKGFLEWK